MKSHEIIYAMGDAMTAKQLEHELFKYIDICETEVIDYILNGIEGVREKLVAWILGLKKYIPDGWQPMARKIKPQSCKSRVEAITHAPSTNITWSDSEKEALRLMVHTGFKNTEISHALKRSEGAISMAISKWCTR